MSYFLLGPDNLPLGPYTLEELKTQDLKPDQLICAAGEKEWMRAADHPEWPEAFQANPVPADLIPADPIPADPIPADPLLAATTPSRPTEWIQTESDVDAATSSLEKTTRDATGEAGEVVEEPEGFVEPHGPADRQRRSIWAMVGVGLTVALTPISIWSSRNFIAFMRRVDAFDPTVDDGDALMADADQVDALQSAVGTFTILFYILAIVLFIRWFRIMARDFEARGQLGTTVSGAVWSWFIPIISLFRPYLFIRSMITHSTRAGAAGVVAIFWWVTWVLSNLVSNQMFKGDIGVLVDDDPSVAELIASSQHDIINEYGTIAAGLLCIATIALVTRAAKHWPTPGQVDPA